MRFTLLVLGAPAGSQSSATALRFAHALLARGHELVRVFFYHDAVSVANALCDAADGPGGANAWTELAASQALDLVVCAASASRRGVLEPADARRRGHPGGSLSPGFSIGGLGLLVEASLTSDRVVSFGP